MNLIPPERIREAAYELWEKVLNGMPIVDAPIEEFEEIIKRIVQVFLRPCADDISGGSYGARRHWFIMPDWPEAG